MRQVLCQIIEISREPQIQALDNAREFILNHGDPVIFNWEQTTELRWHS